MNYSFPSLVLPYSFQVAEMAIMDKGAPYGQIRGRGPGAVASDADNGALGDVAGSDQAAVLSVSIRGSQVRSNRGKGIEVPSVDESYNHEAMSAAVIFTPNTFFHLLPPQNPRWGYRDRIRGKERSADLART